MATHKIYRLQRANPFVLLIGFVLTVIVLFWIAKSILRLLALAAPILFIGAVILNYRVVLGYGKWLIDSFKRNPLFGILACVFSFIGFPLVAAFLFFRAVSSRNTNDTFGEKGGFISYEEVNDDFLDISDITEKGKKMDNDYNDVIK